ncbi:MAG: hypothetical protein OJI67_08945 [Prosthecobacter sp.]|nr:hypothetical protein [Prosthecobacter sp.]
MTFPDAIVAALITFAGTVVLAPLVNRLVQYLFEKRTRLLVNTQIWNFQITKDLSNVLEKARHSLEFNDPGKEALRYDHIDSYIEIELTNKGKRRINSVTLSQDFGSGYYEIAGKNETHRARTDERIELGDLQPGKKFVVRFWTLGKASTMWALLLRRKVAVSADEIDHIRWKFPLPEYLARKYAVLPKWVEMIWWVVAPPIVTAIIFWLIVKLVFA